MKTPSSICITFLVIFFSITLKAQIKIHPDYHISLMSLNKGGGIQIQPTGYTYFQPQIDVPWAWMNLTYAKVDKSKCWIVQNKNSHTFCVTGEGVIYSNNNLSFAQESEHSSKGDIVNALEIISKINGAYYNPDNSSNDMDSIYYELLNSDFVSKEAIPDLMNDYNKRNIALIATEVETALPDAIRTFSDGRKAIDYNAVLTVLIEAVKEQQQEISYLRKLIEKKDAFDTFEFNYENDIKYSNDAKIDVKSILYQNAPNPFNTSTTIEYEVNELVTTKAVINIYNLQGTQLKSYPISQGKGKLSISSNKLTAGIYFYTLIVNNKEIDTKRMILTQ